MLRISEKVIKSNYKILLRSCSQQNVKAPVIKYTQTINLPKTNFPSRLGSSKRLEVEKVIVNKCFKELYSWQSKNLKEPEFILHDGPPYANGDMHIGHAINKILKDIILRYHITVGQKIHYIPGWDCHGLPIELKAMKDQNVKHDPLVIRKTARNFAQQTIEKQKSAFERWGVVGDWSNEKNLYKTFDKSYIKNEIKMFYELYKKGYIYRVLKPVYWSPSSKTALAEAELEYDPNFVSLSTFVRFKLKDLPENMKDRVDGHVYAVIWTTTPWTLPSNQAVCYSNELEYSLVKFMGTDSSESYIIASELLQSVQETLGQTLEVIERFSGESLALSTYYHPINQERVHRFLPADHVQSSKGSGLVHTAPAHGPDDFLVSLKHNIETNCIVDENGNYTEESPEFLWGKNVLTDGNQLVLDHLGSNVLKVEEFCHSYPIDWRTKQPVIFRASKQWFIDTERIKSMAADIISNDVEFFPLTSSDMNKKSLLTQVLKRPYWCISRQRSWGVPIPVFYRKDTGEPVVEEGTINRILELIDKNQSIDFWWNQNAAEILPQSCLMKLGLEIENIDKGNDILDIWFDSGISWSYALENDRIADMYIEGKDQCTGWFQTSLLTSVAFREKAPYKSVFVHGFAVDEKGHKMSKSLGNVIAPDDIIKSYGTDSLRWWVASHATQHTNIEVSKKLLESANESYQKLRSTLKYLVGVVEKIPNKDAKMNFDLDDSTLKSIDKSILYSTQRFNETLLDLYKTNQFNRVTASVLNYITNDLSASYLHLVKDRLYCDTGASYQNLERVFEVIFVTLCKNLYPITPFLVEEVWSYYNKSPFYKSVNFSLAHFRRFEHISNNMNKVNEIRETVNQLAKGQNTWTLNSEIVCNSNMFHILKDIHPDGVNESSDSELCEWLQLSSIKLSQSDENVDESCKFTITLTPDSSPLCPRCRRFSLKENDHSICKRCDRVLKSKK